MIAQGSSLRIVVFRESRYWLAQGLEHDIGVQAEDLKDLMCRLLLMLEVEAATLTRLPPAPKYFQDLWPHKAGLLAPDGVMPNVAIELGLVA